MAKAANNPPRASKNVRTQSVSSFCGLVPYPIGLSGRTTVCSIIEHYQYQTSQ